MFNSALVMNSSVSKNQLLLTASLIGAVSFFATMAAVAEPLSTLADFNLTGTRPYIPTSIVQGSGGAFYGTTNAGGRSDDCGVSRGVNYGCGTLFKMAPNGIMLTLVNLNNKTGSEPSDLVEGADGNFYGTMTYGGDGEGTVFKMTPAGTFTTLASFNNIDDSYVTLGVNNKPSRLVKGNDGNFYGTTNAGGSSRKCTYASGVNLGCGTVFKVTPSGNLTTLINFNGSNGAYPSGGLIQGSDGNLYGTTIRGGSSNQCHRGLLDGCGTIFKITPQGTLVTLISFDRTNNGAYPQTALTEGSDGNLYGTTTFGGSAGTIFKVAPKGRLTTLNFLPSTTFDPLVEGSDGNFYGTTFSGGSSHACDYIGIQYLCGTIFKMSPNGNLNTIVNFNADNGAYPSSLVRGNVDGNLYGTTQGGGNFGYGTTFKVSSIPIITSFSIPDLPTEPVIITGANFTGATSVTFGGAEAVSFMVDTDAQITAYPPPTAGNGITVTTPKGTGSNSTFAVPPDVRKFSPEAGTRNTDVFINGFGFVDVTKVNFNGVSALFHVISVNRIKASVPEGATTGRIEVVTNGGMAHSSTKFTITP